MLDLLFIGLSFFFKQKTAYEMRISDWSSDVCSSDLGTEFPIHFVSRAFTECEARWSTIEQECFAIYYAITSCEHYLRGHRFVVETDHRNLEFMAKATAPKVIRWRLRLQEYDFEVRYIPGDRKSTRLNSSH